MHIDFRSLLPLVIIGGGFVFTGTVMFGAWLLGRYQGRDEELPVELAAVRARLERLEYLLAQNTNMLERVEAAHRYTARLITDEPANVPRLPGRQVTPH